MGEGLSRKIFAGARLRRLRRDLNLTQSQMAEGLGISPSYLNLVERDQRPLSAQLILRLADTYDVNLRTLSADDSGRIVSDLREVFADPLLADSAPAGQDFMDIANSAGPAAHTIVTLYRAYRQLMERTADLAERMTDGSAQRQIDPVLPTEEVRDFYINNRNYFPELEEAAERLWETSLSQADDLLSGLKRHLRVHHSITVKIMSIEFMEQLLRRYDRHSKRLFISELLAASGQRFQIAFQIALIEQSELMDRIIAQGNIQKEPTRRSLRIALANHYAGAVLMPYEQFLRAAEKTRYDIQLLCQRFEVSYEQACHRLTTLQRPAAQGISFFFIRVDRAGNISKRLNAGGFHFARFGGACPRWNVHDVFRNPGRILTQIVQMPDKSTYFSISRTSEALQNGYHASNGELAIGLGCEIGEAHKLVYSDGYDLSDPRLVTPIGLNCRLCERVGCSYRAFPPINRALLIDENTKTLAPFHFTETR